MIPTPDRLTTELAVEMGAARSIILHLDRGDGEDADLVREYRYRQTRVNAIGQSLRDATGPSLRGEGCVPG